MKSRVNARLDERDTQKLEYLKDATGLTTSEVVKEALSVYFRQVSGESAKAAETLASTGFLGSGEAASNLSENYKEALSEELDKKHGHR